MCILLITKCQSELHKRTTNVHVTSKPYFLYTCTLHVFPSCITWSPTYNAYSNSLSFAFILPRNIRRKIFSYKAIFVQIDLDLYIPSKNIRYIIIFVQNIFVFFSADENIFTTKKANYGIHCMYSNNHTWKRTENYHCNQYSVCVCLWRPLHTSTKRYSQ